MLRSSAAGGSAPIARGIVKRPGAAEISLTPPHFDGERTEVHAIDRYRWIVATGRHTFTYKYTLPAKGITSVAVVADAYALLPSAPSSPS